LNEDVHEETEEDILAMFDDSPTDIFNTAF